MFVSARTILSSAPGTSSAYEGDKCERLHGHNYRAAIEGEGVLDENFTYSISSRSRTARRPSPTSSIIA